ncbi:MAG TPA: 2-amino-4-hydroxy-6-hydroxymethyldihydropteridine diphosphokinase [Anaerolineales bacterium]|nr:2-amino-4-hydroxy-6-hydroxymethyldihydropteridine diphosphokinase [Anaerolineales bacterium]
MGEEHRAFLGLGTNLGDRQSNLLQALQLIRSIAVIQKISSIYETKPVGYLDQPDFLNLVCQITTGLSAIELLQALKLIETQLGRQASFRNAPRVIDVDILLFDDLVMQSPDLTIPHLRLAERAFALIPLAEIAPDLVHPGLQSPIAQILTGVDVSGVKLFSRELQPSPSEGGQNGPPS